MASKKKIMKVARDVIAGDYGSGEERTKALKKKGYNPDMVQTEVNRLLSCRELIIQGMREWAIKVSAEPYVYVYWTQQYGHECAKCHPHGGKNKGWQCIGWPIACWHHGGGLPIPCNCGTLDNGTCERILKAKTDAEALKIAQSELKIKDIKVIRNGGKLIPTEKIKPGDIGALYTGNEFQHLVMFMGDGKVTDSTVCSNHADDIRADRKVQGRYVSRLKVLIRYTGKGLTKPAKKSVDELAHEVIDGIWYSGDSRKRALTECGYDYAAVQKRVNEILDQAPASKPDPVPAPVPAPAPLPKYTGKLPTLKIVKTNAEVIADAIIFGKWIAGDNNFHYGHGKDAHHNGCYFCGTQPASKKKSGIKYPERTYCCNPFVHACWAHGGCVPKALDMCQRGKSWDFNKGSGYDASSLFTKLGKPDKSKLKKGDVLCSGSHVALYIGSGKVVEASKGDDNVPGSKSWNNSIHIGSLNYSSFTRVYRFDGSVKTEAPLRHGEVSDRVADLQRFLIWKGYSIEADRIFGDATFKALKSYQNKKGLTPDGIAGAKTLMAIEKEVS